MNNNMYNILHNFNTPTIYPEITTTTTNSTSFATSPTFAFQHAKMLTENATSLSATSSTTTTAASMSTSVMSDVRCFDAVCLLWLIGGPIVFIVGICGNIFVLIVMTKKHMGGTSTCIHLTTMAISDLLVMITGTIPEWFEYCFRKKFKEIHPATCKLEKFFFYTSSDVSILVLVWFTIDRYIAVCHPLRRKSICTVSRAKLLICVTIILIISKNINVFWTRGIDYKKPNKMCGITAPEYEIFETQIRSWLVLATVHAPPAIVIIFCNSFIVRALYLLNRKPTIASFQFQLTAAAVTTVSTVPAVPSSSSSSKIFQRSPSPRLFRNVLLNMKAKQKSHSWEDFPAKLSKEKSPNQQRKSMSSVLPRKQSEVPRMISIVDTPMINNRALVQMTAMCLSASISFLVFYTPTLVFYIGREPWGNKPWYQDVKKLNVFFIHVHHAINFILYCIAGQRFRSVFVDFFKSLTSKKDVSQMKSRKYSDWGETTSRINTPALTNRSKHLQNIYLQSLTEDEHEPPSTLPENGKNLNYERKLEKDKKFITSEFSNVVGESV